MTSYRVNEAAVAQARRLIDAGTYDDETPWSAAAPSAADANEVIEQRGWDGFGAWHLGVDTDASEETKGRFAFPYGDFRQVNRAALIHCKQRASQNDHAGIEKAAGELLERLDATRG